MVGPGGDVPSVWSPGSPEALAIADLFRETLVVCAVIFALVAGLVGYCVQRFRHREGDADPAQVHGNTRLEIAWTAVPVAIVVAILALTTRTMSAVDPPADRAPDLVVVGHQWWWEVKYPGPGGETVTANEIHVPVGRKLLVQVEATDVIHDFWVPALARKVDAVPGHPNHVWMTVTAPGVYLGACAEYCGAQHAWMRIRVVAQPAAEFDAWLANESRPGVVSADEAAVRGAHIFQERTCARFHAVGGVTDARVAPDLTHLASRATLAAGAAENTPAELARWLEDPDTIKPSSHMPNLHLTDAQVNDLVAYFETLR